MRNLSPTFLPRLAGLTLAAVALLTTACGDDDSPASCAEGVSACASESDCGGFACVSACCTTNRICQSDAECPQGQFCNGGVCEVASGPRCASNQDCINFTDTPLCDLSAGTCVGCITNFDCSTNNSKVCNAQKQCEDRPGGCASDADCRGNADGTRCNLTRGECVECLVKEHCIGNNVCVDETCKVPNTGCTTDAACADPTGRCNAANGMCVQCVESTDCGFGEKCTNQACVDAGCTSDQDCAAAPNSPRCNVVTAGCVACIADNDCGSGFVCGSNNACELAPGCQDDAGCASADSTRPYCVSETGSCVQCRTPTDCGSGRTCAGNVCEDLPSGCTSDAACAATPATSKCDVSSGACVGCLAATDCAASGLCDSTTRTCQDGCASDDFCAAPTAKCDTASSTCVACLTGSDCASGEICRSQACVPGCATDADCLTNPVGSKCDTTANECVACLENVDCATGEQCDSNQCVDIPTGVGDPPCGADASCADGSVCLAEGEAEICRTICDPYNPGTTCGDTKACTWIGYDDELEVAGACVPRNERRGAGEACASGADCEQDLVCGPFTATESVCTPLCDPFEADTCATGNSCHALPGLYDGENDVILAVGICLPEASSFGESCTSDYTSNGQGGTTADCGAGMTCGPNGPVVDPSIRVSMCQFPFGEGEADTSCTDGAQCKTGDCLGGPRVCNTSCRWTSDCTRAFGAGSAERCLPYPWLSEDAAGDVTFSSTGACLPTCQSDDSCGADRHCMLSPTNENSGLFNSSFYSFCYFQFGDDQGPQKSAGQRCVADGECASGLCLTNGTAGASDGYCFGSCNPSSGATGQCDAANGVVCDPAGVGLPLNDGADGAEGTADDAYGRAYVCGGKRCNRDSDCAGTSGDSGQERTCQLALQVDGPNSEFGASTTLRTTCEPRFGPKAPGEACTASPECGTGACFLFEDDSSACLGSCQVDEDCATGSSCQDLALGDVTLRVCEPN